MVDTEDLKSFALKACGFDSHPGHHRGALIGEAVMADDLQNPD